MCLLSHYKNNISRNRVWTLERKPRFSRCVLFVFIFFKIQSCECTEIDLLVSDVGGEAAAHREQRVLCAFLIDQDQTHITAQILLTALGAALLPATFTRLFYSVVTLAALLNWTGRCGLMVFGFYLISFFGENDLCAFFPSRFHIYG